MNVVSWDQICKPKNIRGLGVWPIQQCNKALLAKFSLKFATQPTMLWRQVMQGIYGVQKGWEISNYRGHSSVT